MTMKDRWFARDNHGREIGPLAAAELRRAAATGRLRPEHQVRRGDSERWVSANAVKGLFEQAAAPLKPADTIGAHIDMGRPPAEGKSGLGVPMDGLWHWTLCEEQQIPTTLAVLQQLAIAGRLKPTELVWRIGMSEWLPAGETAVFNSSAVGLSASPPPPLPKVLFKSDAQAKLASSPSQTAEQHFVSARGQIETDSAGPTLDEFLQTRQGNRTAFKSLTLAAKLDGANEAYFWWRAIARPATDITGTRLDLKRALRINPNSAPALLLLAKSEIGERRYLSASVLLWKLLSQSPRHLEAAATLCTCYRQLPDESLINDENHEECRSLIRNAGEGLGVDGVVTLEQQLLGVAIASPAQHQYLAWLDHRDQIRDLAIQFSSAFSDGRYDSAGLLVKKMTDLQVWNGERICLPALHMFRCHLYERSGSDLPYREALAEVARHLRRGLANCRGRSGSTDAGAIAAQIGYRLRSVEISLRMGQFPGAASDALAAMKLGGVDAVAADVRRKIADGLFGDALDLSSRGKRKLAKKAVSVCQLLDPGRSFDLPTGPSSSEDPPLPTRDTSAEADQRTEAMPQPGGGLNFFQKVWNWVSRKSICPNCKARSGVEIWSEVLSQHQEIGTDWTQLNSSGPQPQVWWNVYKIRAKDACESCGHEWISTYQQRRRA